MEKKDARTGRRQQDCGKVKADDDETGRHSLSTSPSTLGSLSASKSSVILKAHLVEQIGQVQVNLTQEIPISTQRRILKDGKRCFTGRRYRGQLSRQKKTRNTGTARCWQKKRQQTVYERIGFFVTVNAFRRNTGSAFTRKTLSKITGIITIGPVVENHISSEMAGRSIATQRTTYPSLSLVYRRALQGQLAYISDIFIAGNHDSHGASSSNKKWEYEWGSTGEPVAWTSINRKHQEMKTTWKNAETCRMIC